MAKPTLKVGDYVRTTRHGYMGRVYKFERLGPDAADWIRGQTIPLTLEQCLGEFVGILVHDGGAVLMPIDSCVKIPAIKGFKHHTAKNYFEDMK